MRSPAAEMEADDGAAETRARSRVRRTGLFIKVGGEGKEKIEEAAGSARGTPPCRR
jgi:hypothetical protein